MPLLTGANGLLVAAEIFAVLALILAVAWFGHAYAIDITLIALGILITALHLVGLKLAGARVVNETAKIGLLLAILLPGLAFLGAVFLVPA